VFEQDYIMRLIKEMVRAILKLFFNIDTENPTAEIIEEQKVQDTLNELLDLVDRGNVNEAENRLYELTCRRNKSYLEMGLLFYSYLNDKDDGFLLDHDFSREEIKYGLKELAARYGIEGITDIFLM